MLRLIVDGDAAGGWIVDLHDGDTSQVYHPPASCKTAPHAAMAALVEHDGGLAAPAGITEQHAADLEELADVKKTLADAEAEVMKSTPEQQAAALQELTPVPPVA